jgi:hypothetical protein
MKRRKTRTERRVEAGYPVLTANDAAEYLADILPQLALIAKTSGLSEIGEMVTEVSGAAEKERSARKA